MSETARVLAWDSEFFDCRIARAAENVLTAESADALLAWCAAEKIDCLYFLADSADAATARIAQAKGFHFVDTRMTLDIMLKEQPGNAPRVRLSRAEDVARLKAIARVNHTDSRFYYDPVLPKERCDALYETWIERSCGGYADAVLVAVNEQDAAAGYITCDLREDGVGQIGLLGMGEAYRGRGLGTALIRAGLGWFWERGAHRVEVVTQARNVGAQRAYQKQGFMTAKVENWYHWWAANRAKSS